MSEKHPLQPFVDSGEIVSYEDHGASRAGFQPWTQHYKVFMKNIHWQERERLRGRIQTTLGHTLFHLIDVDTGEELK